ncbi:MAG: hypothetical protein BZY80_01475 [SAR202 cluster bacterium Io17-Chloro-G2]|nr:MAG: hypothetical protein BZY80_01475 [SAR202 cluster bacterium Io17-Chloro-G2]
MMIDGLDPAYLETCPAPNLEQLARDGFKVEAKAVMPTVTNVNNVSLVTASYPEEHGITSNYWRNRDHGQDARSSTEFYMESGEYIQKETMFERATAQGSRSLLVTAKDKLRRLLGDGATLSVSSEQPPDWVVAGVGEPPPIYSIEVNQWVVNAAQYILGREQFDLAYVTTTDYAMHTYAPGEPESLRHIKILDEAIGRLVESIPNIQVLITADHGMSAKNSMVHLPDVLATHGIKGQAVPIIKDMYTAHHSNLGGCIYVYLEAGDVDRAVEVLKQVDGVDDALPRQEAAQRFRLMPGRIGDVMVLGSPGVVFGDPQEVELPSALRSHGSLHEDRVPVIGYGGPFDRSQFRENVDLGRYVFQHVLA